MPALSAHGLIKRYGTRVALDDVSIAVEPGEFVAVSRRPTCDNAPTRCRAGSNKGLR
jgi:ABC-type phosphonate transport system ATPase subunit